MITVMSDGDCDGAGVNPLDSFSTVEANNSFLLVNDTNAYQALEAGDGCACDGCDQCVTRLQ